MVLGRIFQVQESVRRPQGAEVCKPPRCREYRGRSPVACEGSAGLQPPEESEVLEAFWSNYASRNLNPTG